MNARIRIDFGRYLASFHVTLAVILAIWGKVETEKYFRSTYTYDYIAPAEKAIHLVNIPAAFLVSSVSRNKYFQIGIEYSITLFVVYLILIFVLWFGVGRRLSSTRQSFKSRSLSSRVLGVAGVVYGSILIVFSFVMPSGPLALIFPMSMFIWGALIIVLCW